MKIYLASGFKLRKWVEHVHDALVKAGHEVPDVWWEQNFRELYMDEKDWYKNPIVQGIASRHWANIRECDALVLVCDPSDPGKFNGANVELGFALGLGKPCFSIGALERSAMYCPVRKCGTVQDLLFALAMKDVLA